MVEKRTSLFENGLIWFGAGVSIAEILTGTAFAPLGLKKGILAIVIGHIIGCVMLYLAGVIGGNARRSAMDSVKSSFGQRGSLLFAILNVVQLVGWTSIMIYDGAISADGVFNTGRWVWCLVIGVLIIAWILIGVKNLGKVNTVSMALLFILTLVLCYFIFFKGQIQNSNSVVGEAMSFGAAVELSVAMPLSWLPVISDYTREAQNPKKASLVSTIVYGLVSTWMYIIGMGAAIFTQQTDIAQIMLKAGLGVAGLLIIVFSTVTTTFLDAYSAGVSSESISPKIKGKWFAVGATILGTVCAIAFQITDITNFLYFIGSVFAPMIAVQIADTFILHRDNFNKKFDIQGLLIWLVGFVAYRLLMKVDIPVGNTLPDMVIVIALAVLVEKIRLAVSKKKA